MTEEALLPPGAPGPGSIHSYEGAGGRELRYRVVEAETTRHALLYFHGIESHGTWFLPAAYRLRQQGCTTYLLDRRGSGLNRGAQPGYVESAAQLLEDVQRFRAHLGDPDLHLVGVSWGGKLATAAAMARPERTRSLVLITPAFKTRIDLTPAQKLGAFVGNWFGGGNLIKLPIEPEMFSDSRPFLEFIRNDSWRLERASARLLWSGLALDRRISQGMPALDLPVLLFLTGGERIIDNEGARRCLSRLPAGRCRERFYEPAVHAIHIDQLDDFARDITNHLNDGHEPR